jgi:DNA-binding NarL/FixJ family response regulator
MRPRRILLADDRAVFLVAVGQLLATCPRVAVAGLGRTGRGRDAVVMAGLLKPHLVMMDLSMSELSGLQAARSPSTCPAAPRIIIMSVDDLPEYRPAA